MRAAITEAHNTIGALKQGISGSVTGCLADYLPGDLLDIRVEQGCEIGRPFLVHCRAERHGDSITVQVGTRVIPVARGELL